MMPIPIRSLLLQPKLWKFVGFGSSLVGLLCFARSSSFNHVFGEWNLVKVYLYIGISCIICGFMLFAYKWQLPRSLLLKAHVGFFVLMLISLYSFFSNVENESKEPKDRCSPISSAAFALASLGLSRQIDLGFEVDLFNFFLGSLIVQLMTINRKLAFLGAPFSYLLVLLRSHIESQLHTGTVTVTEHVALEIDNANGVEERDVRDCEKDFYTNLGVEQVREERVLFPPDIEAKLREGMAAGFANECCHVFINWRRQFLDDKLLKIQLKKLNISEIDKVPVNYLEDKIQRWIMASNYVLRILLTDERKLCNHVFSEFPPYADLCFKELCQGSMNQLLNFAKAIANGNGSPERLFRILKMFETLTALLPDFNSLFSDQYTVRREAITIWKRLGESIRGVFMDLENLICQNPVKVVVPSGGLHPITHYVINYLSVACVSWRNLDQVFRDNELPLREYPVIENGESLSSPFTFKVARIMELLKRYLETHSETYKDSALSSVFMMNNVCYMVHKAKGKELGKLLGGYWVQEHTEKVEQYLVKYTRSSRDQLLDILILKHESLRSVAAAESFKEKLNLFTVQFEEICEVQSKWVIFDALLKKEVRSSLKKILLPAYEKFMARFHKVVETREHIHIEAKINNLFKGKDELKNCRNIQPSWTVIRPTAKDLYDWRKRGQEIIHKSTYRRNHYWCIHKFSQGCQAIKQVQQIQENPEMYETKYTGFHTCRVIPEARQMLTI